MLRAKSDINYVVAAKYNHDQSDKATGRKKD